MYGIDVNQQFLILYKKGYQAAADDVSAVLYFIDGHHKRYTTSYSRHDKAIT